MDCFSILPLRAGFCSFQAEQILAPGLRKWGTAHRTDGSRLLYAALSAQDSLLESDFTTEPFGREKAIDKLRQIANPPSSMAEPSDNEIPLDPWLSQFFQHLTSRNSPYTLRNYSRALFEFKRWYQKGQKGRPCLCLGQAQRFDFRTYLHSLGMRNIGRSSTQIRFAALRSFYRFLVRQRLVEAHLSRDSKYQSSRSGWRNF